MIILEKYQLIELINNVTIVLAQIHADNLRIKISLSTYSLMS